MTQPNSGNHTSDHSQLIGLTVSDLDAVKGRVEKDSESLTLVNGDQFVTIGWLKGEFVVPADFDEPLPNELLGLFEGIGE
jgi:hypothetical protein